MTDSKVKLAAKRMRKHLSIISGLDCSKSPYIKPGGYDYDYDSLCQDTFVLRDAYLAEHPEGDECDLSRLELKEEVARLKKRDTGATH